MSFLRTSHLDFSQCVRGMSSKEIWRMTCPQSITYHWLNKKTVKSRHPTQYYSTGWEAQECSAKLILGQGIWRYQWSQKTFIKLRLKWGGALWVFGHAFWRDQLPNVPNYNADFLILVMGQCILFLKSKVPYYLINYCLASSANIGSYNNKSLKIIFRIFQFTSYYFPYYAVLAVEAPCYGILRGLSVLFMSALGVENVMDTLHVL